MAGSKKFTSRTSWRAKLERGEPDWKETPKGRMYIPTPMEVDGLMRRVGDGELTTVAHIRQHLAASRGADYACPLCTGMFVRIAAEAAEEDAREGRGPITPYWRTLATGGHLNEKYPGGVDAQAQRLRSEGHAIDPAQGRKPPRVAGFERRLARL